MWWALAAFGLYLLLSNWKPNSADDDVCPDGVGYCPQGEQYHD